MVVQKRNIVSVIMLLLFCLQAKATHIVGGEMNYTCLGDDQYEITLTIFRDCFNGNPNAWFDDPASIGVFDDNNVLLQEILIPLMNNDTLEPVLTSECLVVPPNVCVHTTTYTTVVELPPRAGGYQLAYQRCCRNQTIVNIVDPLDTGATYGVTISEEALNECNSNPKFQQWPPIYICVNEPIVFDQSAIDQDGDSIVYSLCTPLSGANPAIPQPQPPNNPPYLPISWVNPPYGVDNMLNGTPGGVSLEINPQTGLLTGLPNTIGQFVVGICVEEYRDGQLISTTRRDFQYNVGLCGEASAAFTAPEIQCGFLSVAFDNQSQGSSEYLWHFNDPGNPGATSTATNPVYTFSDTGLYNVMLIVAPGEVCEDTAYQEIYLQNNTIDVSFELDQGPCSDSVIISAMDLSVDSFTNIESWEWAITPGGFSSEEQNPEFVIAESGSYMLSLTVTNDIGCSQTLSEGFVINLIEEDLVADTLAACQGDQVQLNPVQEGNYEFLWQENTDFDDLSNPNPSIIANETQTYHVTITDALSGCEAEQSITVLVPEPVIAEPPLDTSTCLQELWLHASSNTGVQYFWFSDADFSLIIGETDSLLATPQGPTTYYLLVRDEYGCSSIDSVTIEGNAVDIIATSQQAICPGDFGAVAVVNLDEEDILEISWTPTDNIVAGENNSTAFLFLTEPGAYPMFAEVSNQYGCSALDSTIITLIDTTDQTPFLMDVQCSSYNVLFSSSSVNAPFYIWSFGDPNDPGAMAVGENVSHLYSEPGTYEVTITLSSFIQCPDTIIQEITVDDPSITPDFDWEVINCSDSITIQFNDLSVNDQSNIIEWEWSIGTAFFDEQNPIVVFDEDQELTAQLTIVSDDGCQDSTIQLIPIEVPQIDLPDTLIACPGTVVELNPLASEEFTYLWSPEEYFTDPTIINPLLELVESVSFSVVATTQDGDCVLERSIYAFVPPHFSYSLPSDTTLCEEEFLLYVDSDDILEVIWQEVLYNDTITLGAEPELLVNPGDNSFYIALMTDVYGCVQIDSVEVDYNEILTFLNASTPACLGDTVQIEVINLTDASLSYSWSPISSILEGENTSTILVSPNEGQTYTVAITNEDGCSIVESTQVQVSSELPPLVITADPDTLYSVGDVQLEATYDPGYSYLWQPSNGLNSITIFNPTARVDSTITYVLDITDEDGCTNQAAITLTLFSDCIPPYIYVPNAFTPNGDNLNDELLVQGGIIEELYFAVYNRWGQLVFETNDPTVGWDGTFKGEHLAPDAYAYYLEVSCFNGEVYFGKGNISLIR